MMKQIVVCALLIGLSGFLFGQSYGKPYWIDNPPQAKSNSSYYYRVSVAEERTYDKAYAKAFARAILESSWKLGVAVSTKDDIQTLENNITENINVMSQSMKLPMNKVCEYIEEDKSSSNMRVYILWQVAKYSNLQPNFEDFNKCR